MGAASTEAFADTSSVLVLASDAALDPDDSAYWDLVEEMTGERPAVVLVTFERPPNQRAQAVREKLGAPDAMRVVAVGESARTVGATEGPTDGPVAVVEHPGDLTELGIRLSEALEDWQDRDDLVVCFHSLTALLDHATVERAFRFLHVLTSRLQAAEATAFFHLDPEAHDPSAVATLQPLFDGILQYEDGEWTMIRR